MATIVKRPRARIDLAEIWEYIAEDNVEQADAFIGTIDRAFHALAEQPNMGRWRDEHANRQGSAGLLSSDRQRLPVPH